jgi:hypothetical protein
MSSAPVLLSSTIQETVIELAKRAARNNRPLRIMDARLAELTARRAFHLDPTPENLTAWCNANDTLVDVLQ